MEHPSDQTRRAIFRHPLLNPIEKRVALSAVYTLNCTFDDAETAKFFMLVSNLRSLPLKSPQKQLVATTITYLDQRLHIVPLNDGRVDWFFFKNHRWRLLHEGTAVLKHFILAMCCLLDTLAPISNTQAHFTLFNTDDGPDGIIRDIASILSVGSEGFIGRLDTCHHLIGFDNGVYDMNQKIFRAGLPGDYIRRSTGYNYTKSHPDVEVVKSFLKSLFAFDKLYEHAIKIFARALHGSPADQLIVLYGPPSAGKSTLARLLLYTGGFLGYSKLYRQGAIEDMSGLVSMFQEGQCDKTMRIKIFDQFAHPPVGKLINDIQTDEMLLWNPHNGQRVRAYDQNTTIVTCSDTSTLAPFAQRCIILPLRAPVDGNFEYPRDITLSKKVSGWGPATMSLLLQTWEENDALLLDAIIHTPLGFA